MVFRTDIQALRGLAVLFVVLYHAKLGLLEAGYLGVDIFFVISGYLITGIVKKGIEQGTFSFSEFYFRRAKRLLPAAYVTFAVTVVLSVSFLVAGEFKDFTKQLIGAVTFTSNIVLWQQAGYFEGSAELKPLLHIWSLSIEEQYYLFLPATLFFIPRRFWLIGTGLLLITSLVLCFILVPLKPIAAFYLLPTRAWELTIGSFSALVLNKLNNSKKVQLMLSILFWPSVIALIVIPIIPIGKLYPFYFGRAHPGVDALIICIATAIILLRQHEALNAHFSSRALAKVGDFSYSLYLVHWPIFAFIHNAYIGEPSTELHEIALVLALCIGFLLYRYVELPVRRMPINVSRKLVVATTATSFILVLTPFVIFSFYMPTADYTQVRRINTGFGMDCEFTKNFIPKAECRNSDQSSMMIWGDSYAMHLVSGIVATTDAGVIQAARSNCGPFIGVAPINTRDNTRSWAERCLELNQSVFDYLAVTPSIKIVVMSSPFTAYLIQSDAENKWRSLVSVDGNYVEQEPSISGAIDGMRKTAETLRKLGKRIVIVAPPPSSDFDIGLCLERKATGKVTFGVNSDCSIPIDDYHKKRAPVLNFLKRVQNELDIPVVSFDNYLCSKSLCVTQLDGVFVYRDARHLSYDGSQILAKKMGLGKLLEKMAY